MHKNHFAKRNLSISNFKFTASAYEKVDAKKSEAFVKIGRNIIENGANIEARNSDGDTALMVAAGKGRI